MFAKVALTLLLSSESASNARLAVIGGTRRVCAGCNGALLAALTLLAEVHHMLVEFKEALAPSAVRSGDWSQSSLVRALANVANFDRVG